MTQRIPSPSRREMLATLLLGGGVVAASGLFDPVRAASARSDLFFIGMHGADIHAARFDPATGAMAMIGPVAQTIRPTWAVRHPFKPILYVSNEGGDDGTVLAYAIDRATGTLAKIGEVRAGGGGTTYIWFDRPSMTLLAANYGGGSVAAMPVLRDGSLSERVSLIHDVGTGPHRRQTAPHAHAVVIDPGGRFALVPDLGADRVFVYPFDRKTHRLNEDPPAAACHFAVAPGSGPRHLTFHPRGRTAYLVAELTAEIIVLSWDTAHGRLTEIQKLPTYDPAATTTRSAAEVVVSPDGRFLYVSNRGDGNLLAYAIDPRSGKLTEIQRLSSGGQIPWTLNIHKSGRWMLVAHERSDRIDVFAIDPRSGQLTPTGKSLATPKPVSITFDY